MRKYVTALAAAAVLATMGSALANDTTGKIVKIDPARDEITVEKHVIKIDGVKLDGLKVGDEVKATYIEMDDGNHLQGLVKQ